MFVRLEIEKNAYSKVNSDATINHSLSLHFFFPARKPSKKHMNPYSKKRNISRKTRFKPKIALQKQYFLDQPEA
jgi:hypothetical protein